MTNFLKCFWIASWLIGGLAHAQSPVLTLTKSDEFTDLWGRAETEFYVDSSRYQSLTQVKQQVFEPTAGHSSSFGFTNASIWIRFRLRDESSTPTARIMGTGFNLIDTLDYYLVNEATGQLTHQQKPKHRTTGRPIAGPNPGTPARSRRPPRQPRHYPLGPALEPRRYGQL